MKIKRKQLYQQYAVLGFFSMENIKKNILILFLLIICNSTLEILTSITLAFLINQLINPQNLNLSNQQISFLIMVAFGFIMTKPLTARKFDRNIASHLAKFEKDILEKFLKTAIHRIRVSSGSNFYNNILNVIEGELATIFSDFFPALVILVMESFFLIFILVFLVINYSFLTIPFILIAICILSLLLRNTYIKIIKHQITRNKLISITISSLSNLIISTKESFVLGTDKKFFSNYIEAKSALIRNKFDQQLEANLQKTLIESIGLTLLALYSAMLHFRFISTSTFISTIVIAFSIRIAPALSRMINAYSRIRSTAYAMNSVNKSIEENLKIMSNDSHIKSISLNNSKGITIKSFTLVINKKTIVKNLNLKLYPGDVVAISGRSGSGKTILLESLAGLRRIESGNIEFDKQIWKRKAYLRQDVQILDGGLLTNVKFGRNKVNTKNFNFLIKHLDMLDLKKVYSVIGGSTLSGGEKQRIGLIRVLVNKPLLILLDEPTSGQDNDRIEQIQKLIKNQKNSIVFFTSHNSDLLNIANVKIRI
jgi:ABC-type transport system involved in cytochrome bd biosynthesis fused ATPase/permease subunit